MHTTPSHSRALLSSRNGFVAVSLITVGHSEGDRYRYLSTVHRSPTLKALLNRDVDERLGTAGGIAEIKKHPFFSVHTRSRHASNFLHPLLCLFVMPRLKQPNAPKN